MTMGDSQRFYQLELRHRPVLNGDIGSLLRINGLVVGGGGAQAILMLPHSDYKMGPVYSLTAEEWTDYLQRSDDPQVLVMPEKAFHRKLRFEISGFVQQKVWKADGLMCMFCQKAMGQVPLTIDHFMPLEKGGKNDTSNYLTACKKCNKDKGSEDPKDFCDRKQLDYEYFVGYLKNRRIA
jgi:hypothetical protein